MLRRNILDNANRFYGIWRTTGYEMIWDVVTKKYVLVEINTNQLSLFQKQQEEN